LPAYSSVFEYEFVSNTPGNKPSFKLHAPLEFLPINSHFVEEQGIDTNTFTTDPYCQNNKLTLHLVFVVMVLFNRGKSVNFQEVIK
jgi:hypothetical protein